MPLLKGGPGQGNTTFDVQLAVEDGAEPETQKVSHSNPALRNAKNQFDKLAIFLCEKKRE